MVKRYNVESKTLVVNNETYTFTLWTTRHCNGTTEHCECDQYEHTMGRYTWSNRPWQSKDYDIATKECADKLMKINKALANALLGKNEQENKELHERCERQVKAFENLYSKIPKTFKDAVAKSDIMLESESDVKSMMGIMAMASLVG